MKNAFDVWDELDDEQKTALREVEAKYKSNRWWESDDPTVLLRFQTEEPIFVLALHPYIDMLGQYLERPVSHVELAYDSEKIKEEVRSAVRRREKGIGQSDEQKEAGHQYHVRRVEDIVDTHLKDRAMKVDLSQKPDRDKDGTDISGYDGWLRPK